MGIEDSVFASTDAHIVYEYIGHTLAAAGEQLTGLRPLLKKKKKKK
jgi:hypothetical protein